MLCVKRYLPNWNFQHVLGEREGIPKKPAPDGAIELAARFGAEPGQCLYLGDTWIDMETARRAGMFPVGVLWGFRDEQELRDSGAKAIIASPLELLPVLDRA